jgi:hypothetical protein
MKNHCKSLLTGILGLVNGFPTEKTDRLELRDFMRKLHPRTTGRPLRRLGPKGDGGYLIPDDLAGIGACFSPGVSTISGFELVCAESGMKVFLADRSVDRPAEEHERFYFLKKHIGASSNDDTVTLDRWVASSVPDDGSDLLLQMDIEGCEYDVLFSISDSLMRRFRIMVVEFHQMDMLWSRPFFRLVGRAFGKILQTHACVHIHPNNRQGVIRKEGLEIPKLLEMTFLRRDRMSSAGVCTDFPHALDFDNAPLPTIRLPGCWYGGG